MEDIPSFAFNKDNIDITKNTSVYNNDYMRNRLENLPLIDVNFPLDLDEYNILRKYIRGRKEFEEYSEKDTEDNEKYFTIYTNIVNNKDTYLNVTSDEIEFFNGTKKVKSFYKNPLLVIRLKSGEEFEFSAKADKGIALNHSRYAVVGMCCYEMINENEFIFKLEPRGQLSISEILSRACKIIKYRLELIINKIKKIKFTSDNHGKIILNNEDHTFGNLIARGLQEHKGIEFAGYKLDHLLIRDVTIEYVINGGKSINEILNDVLTGYIKVYSEIEDTFNKLKL
jgi:DNA-directed RNA polymerase subunit L